MADVRHLALRRLPWGALVCALGVLLTGASLPAQAKQKCTDFSAYAPGDLLPQKLKQDGYTFRFGNASSIFFGGAQFWTTGASITTPKPGDWVEIDVYAGAGFDIVLTGYNAAGGVEDTVTVPINFALNTVRLNAVASPIIKVGLAEGGNESTLNRVCTRY